MAKKSISVMSEKLIQRVVGTVNWVERHKRDLLRNRQTPKWPKGGGGGDCDCPSHVYLIEYKVVATSGTFPALLSVNGSSTTINIPWNEIRTGLQTAIEAWGPFASDPDNYKVSVGGGGSSSGEGLPGNSLTVWFQIPPSASMGFYRGTSTPALLPSTALITFSQMSKPV